MYRARSTRARDLRIHDTSMPQDITPITPCIARPMGARLVCDGIICNMRGMVTTGAINWAPTNGDKSRLYITYHFYIVITVILAKTVLHWKKACAILTVECRLSICLRVMHVNTY